MRNEKWKRWLGTGVFMLGVFLGIWIVPPLLHKTMRLCPVRPSSVGDVQAVPAFARKYGISCSQCHTAFPALNDYGREFKLNGYVRERGSKEGVLEAKDGSLWTEKIFPWGAMVKSRPYDKKQSDREFKLRALHELELFVAGGDASKHVSYFTEVEAEDEMGFSPELGELQVGYHPSRYLNLLLANRSFFMMDPFQTLSNMGKLTRSSRDFAMQGYLSGDSLDGEKQTVAAYGEIGRENVGSLYYAAGLSSDKGDAEGEGPKDGVIRLAFDSLRGVAVGGFASAGHEGLPAAGKKKFSRAGLDALVELFGVTARGAFAYFYDKNTVTQAREANRGAYTEAFYAVNKDDRPFLVPLIRQDWFQTTDGTKQFGNFTGQLSHYFAENGRAFVEYFANTKREGAPKDHRWTLQVEVGF
ncbi:MAG: hypothetical protein HY402_05355 [Elusimicrobia bacterium]|nr:hypothetical protein [Elusimicrobiota bacterium]